MSRMQDKQEILPRGLISSRPSEWTTNALFMPNLWSALAILKTYPKDQDKHLVSDGIDGGKQHESDPQYIWNGSKMVPFK